ncbi:MAG: protein TolQ [Alphaproteobacteria bacterium]|nr:protein TolQ [Alphaproteobacteria bacterium]
MEDAAIVAAEAQQTIDFATQDFSLWALFLRADLVVKLVMLGLISASIWSWAIIFEKTLLMRRLFARANAFESQFWSGESLQTLYRNLGGRPNHPMARVFLAGMREWASSSSGNKLPALNADLIARMERKLTTTIAREMAVLEKRMLFLATVGAVAPFIGLFGTVWGIMNSFQAIALSRDTNLAVVAPGIAEALFATGLGLLAAIPAVIAYNKFTHDLGRYANRMDIFADEFANFFVRQLTAQNTQHTQSAQHTQSTQNT